MNESWGGSAQLQTCVCGAVSGSGFVPGSLRCAACPKPIEQRWWFKLDEWCHRNIQTRGRIGYWLHRPLCNFVERRLWVSVPYGGTEEQ